MDHVDLLKEQLKILSGEVALHSSVLKRLSDEAVNSPDKEQIQVTCHLMNPLLLMCSVSIVSNSIFLNLQLDIRKVKDEIKVKSQQIAYLEKQMADSISSCQNNMDKLDVSPVRHCSS